jgi:hypothetical protein
VTHRNRHGHSKTAIVLRKPKPAKMGAAQKKTTERKLPTDPVRIVLIDPTRHALENDDNENPNHGEVLTDIRHPRRSPRTLRPAQDPIRTRRTVDRKIPSLTNERILLELPSFAGSRIEIGLPRERLINFRMCCLDVRHHYHEPNEMPPPKSPSSATVN